MKKSPGIASEVGEDVQSNLLMGLNHHICARLTFHVIYHRRDVFFGPEPPNGPYGV